MRKRRRVWVGIAAAVLLFIVVGVVLLALWPGHDFLERFEQIEVGMTEGEVEAMLGRRPDSRVPPLEPEAPALVPDGEYTQQWEVPEEGVASIDFGADRKVLRKRFVRLATSLVPWPLRLARRLGL